MNTAIFQEISMQDDKKSASIWREKPSGSLGVVFP